jgi:hypothetical protein
LKDYGIWRKLVENQEDLEILKFTPIVEKIDFLSDAIFTIDDKDRVMSSAF